jgi:hypothetical protein
VEVVLGPVKLAKAIAKVTAATGVEATEMATEMAKVCLYPGIEKR